MNYLDLAILIIIGVSAIVGMYQGFVVAILNIAGFFVSWLGALLYYPKLAQYLDAKFHLLNTIIYYAEGSSKIPAAALKHAVPSSVGSDTINSILQQHGLPSFIGKLLSDNANMAVFNKLGVDELGKYFDIMFGHIILNIISFLIIFAALRIIIGLIISIARHIVDLPVLKQLDSLAGLGLGAFRGLLIVMLAFVVLDIVIIIMPIDFLTSAIKSSSLAPFFYQKNLITNVIKALIY